MIQCYLYTHPSSCATRLEVQAGCCQAAWAQEGAERLAKAVLVKLIDNEPELPTNVEGRSENRSGRRSPHRSAQRSPQNATVKAHRKQASRFLPWLKLSSEKDALAAANVELFRFNKTNLTVRVSAFPSITQPGRIYANTNATYFVKFFSDFTWNLSFYGNWDNEPPPHFSGSKYGMSSGLGWTFGNR